MAKLTIAYTYPILSTSSWGISIVGAKILGNYGYSSLEIVFGRFAIASLIFLPILFIMNRYQNNILPTKKDFIPLLGLAITGVSVNNLIFYYGLNRTNASIASILVSVNPLATMIVASIFLNEYFTKEKLVSVVLGMIGVILIVGYSSNNGQFIGNLFILLAVTIWGISFTFSKILSNHQLSSVAITGWSEILGTLILSPFMIYNQTSKTQGIELNTSIITWFIFLGTISSVIAYIIHYKAIEILGPSKVAPTTNIIPFSGALAAYVLLDEKIEFTSIIGLFLIIIAIYIVQVKKPHKIT